MNDIPIRIVGGLPFVTIIIHANGQSLELKKVLLDTGSGGTVLKADHLVALGVIPEPTDQIRFLHGIGGDEAVIEKSIDALQIGDLFADPFTIQMGAMEYGIPMDGIIGLDFLLRVQVIIDFKALKIRSE